MHVPASSIESARSGKGGVDTGFFNAYFVQLGRIYT
jgi:hypothetical protein